jgi:hypothetical protein
MPRNKNEQKKDSVQRKADRATYSLGEDYIALVHKMADNQRRTQVDLLREAIDRLAQSYGTAPLVKRPHIQAND